MSLPVTMPTKLIERARRQGMWPTAMEVRTVNGQRVATVTAWGPIRTKVEPDAEPTSRRGVMALSARPPSGQGALDL